VEFAGEIPLGPHHNDQPGGFGFTGQFVEQSVRSKHEEQSLGKISAESRIIRFSFTE
jgi:hypothetical protein